MHTRCGRQFWICSSTIAPSTFLHIIWEASRSLRQRWLFVLVVVPLGVLSITSTSRVAQLRESQVALGPNLWWLFIIFVFKVPLRVDRIVPYCSNVERLRWKALVGAALATTLLRCLIILLLILIRLHLSAIFRNFVREASSSYMWWLWFFLLFPLLWQGLLQLLEQVQPFRLNFLGCWSHFGMVFVR